MKRKYMARERIFKKDKEDMMSKLPDEILVSIMSCLPTKQAARTSVVCQRWHGIWKTTISIQPRLIFNLDKGWSSALRKKSFRDAAKDLTKKRINEVNAVLKLHEAPTLDEFSLIASKLEPKHRHHINTWMDFAAKKHVKKLTLQLRSKIGYNATFLADNFGCLRELYIQGILVGENSIHRLFSNSPFLERFSLLNSHTLYHFKIVSAPNLNYLQIEECHNLEHLEISSAGNLKRLKIRSNVALQSVDISSAPNLSDLILGIHGPNFKLDPHLTLLNQIKRLTLDIGVEHLELEAPSVFHMPFYRLLDLVKAAPLLNTFSFKVSKFGHPGGDNALEWLNERIAKKVEVNEHSCQYLKVVKLDSFAGCQYEVKPLLNLLEYAVSVEKIIIRLMSSSCWRNGRESWRNSKEFVNRYEELCLGCVQRLKTQILVMHPNVDVIITYD